MTEQAEALLSQASNLHRQGRRLEAIDLFQRALAIRPEASEGWYELGYLLKAEANYEGALEAYGQALAHGVRRPEEVHLNRAVIYSDHLRRDDAAECELTAALAIDPDYLPALLNLGNLHEERGARQDALACYDRVLGSPATIGPHQELRFEALARSANLRPPASIDDPVFGHLHDASVAAVQHDKTVRANVLFAMGRAYDKLSAYDQAFDAYTKANRSLLRQHGRTYDRSHASRLTDAMIETFTAANQGNSSAAPETGATPLFVCGMFRSGSTLVEQVLGGHPKVTPGGELDWLLRVAAVRLAPFPQSMARLDPARDAMLADEYRAHLASLFPDAAPGTYVTDKRPDNFQLIGFIKRLFPAAKIVHSTRNPLDNGLSVFMQHLHHRVAAYSSDLSDIGHYYGEYRRLMAHWKALYAESIFDFDYDAFVREPRAALEPLFAFLGLDWDDRCLEFHRLGNTVKTASYWQVRRPLYGDASGRWRNYSAHLGSLRAALQAAGVTDVELA